MELEIKTFRAKCMKEALEMVLATFGKDATVLSSKSGHKSRFMGLLRGESYVEVTASGKDRTSILQPPEILPAEERYRCLSGVDLESPSRIAPSAFPSEEDACFQLYTELLEADLEQELARQLIDSVRGTARDTVLLRRRLETLLQREIRVSGPIQICGNLPRIVALVGPTGVGKTTTIAKLAASYHLQEKKKVGLITVDTYRVAAVDQLAQYAQIINLPLEVVSNAHEMLHAIKQMAEYDLVLIDTAGSSAFDRDKIMELTNILNTAKPDEVHLVMSSTARVKVLHQTVEKFAKVGPSRLIITKLDESSGLGNILPVLRSSRLPVSYITNGQNVPDDIAIAESLPLARCILGKREICLDPFSKIA